MKSVILKTASKPNTVCKNGTIYTGENFNELKNIAQERLQNKALYLALINVIQIGQITQDNVVGVISEWGEDYVVVDIEDEIYRRYDFENNKYIADMITISKNEDDENIIKDIDGNDGVLITLENILCFALLTEDYEEVPIITPVPEIEVRYHREICPELMDIEFIPGGDFVDLRAAENITLKKGEFALINLGVSIKLPEGYWGQFVPRSSTYKNFGIMQTNSFAVIDESYCGDDDIWRMPVVATRDTEIKVNDRICQFRIVKKQPFSIVTVDKLEGENRGGIGSTGIN